MSLLAIEGQRRSSIRLKDQMDQKTAEHRKAAGVAKSTSKRLTNQRPKKKKKNAKRVRPNAKISVATSPVDNYAKKAMDLTPPMSPNLPTNLPSKQVLKSLETLPRICDLDSKLLPKDFNANCPSWLLSRFDYTNHKLTATWTIPGFRESVINALNQGARLENDVLVAVSSATFDVFPYMGLTWQLHYAPNPTDGSTQFVVSAKGFIGSVFARIAVDFITATNVRVKLNSKEARKYVHEFILTKESKVMSSPSFAISLPSMVNKNVFSVDGSIRIVVRIQLISIKLPIQAFPNWMCDKLSLPRNVQWSQEPEMSAVSLAIKDYQIRGLIKLPNIEFVSDMIVEAEKHNLAKLKAICEHYIALNLCPRNLSDVVERTASIKALSSDAIPNSITRVYPKSPLTIEDLLKNKCLTVDCEKC